MTLFDSKCIAHPQGKHLISPSSCVAIAIVCTLIHCGGLPSRESAGFDRCLQGCTKLKSRGLSSKNRFILYRGFPLWLGSTGEGCDSIQVSGCQTRAWRSTFYTRASLVHMVLGVLILYWFPFYARLEARLGVQSLYYAKIHPKIKPLILFFHCEAWGSWFYTDVCIYRILKNYI